MTFEDMESMTFETMESYDFLTLTELTAIYDRTQADVDNLTTKGMINYTDANRLEENIKTVADYFGIAFTQTTWVKGDIPMQSDYERWKNAVDSIKTAYDVQQTSPMRPFNTFTKWNQLEYLLFYTDKIFNENEQAKSYCGEFYCGEYGLI